MGHRKVVESYYCDLNNMADFLGKLVNSYRLLVGSADELNKIATASRGDVKDALKMADNLGDVIDDVIEALDYCSEGYLDYCRLKSDAVKCRIEGSNILTEIDETLKLEN